MIEQKMRSALLLFAGLALASGAWGQTTTITQTKGGNINVASEFFGSPEGREVNLILPDVSDFASAATSQPYIVLTIAQVGGAGVVGSGNTTMITYTLYGATFAASASGTDLRYFEGAALDTDGDIVVRLADGGNRGDRMVTYEVETKAEINPGAGARALYFFPPDLQVAPVALNPQDPASAMGAMVVASIDSSGATVASNPFPRNVLGTGTDRSTGASVVNRLADGEILRLMPALSASLGTPGAASFVANVDIENRKALADGVAVTMAGQDRPSFGLKVGELSISLTPEANAPRVLRTLNVTNDGGDLDSALSGTADVTVSGPFQQGDMVILGEDRTSDDSKTFEMAADRMSAMVSVPIDAMTSMNVVYVPGGVMDLQPGMFRASLALDFNDQRAASGMVRSTATVAGASSGTVQYAGITTQAYAHGVSRASDAAVTSFLRLTCAGVTPPATGCNVFLSCSSEDGAPYFGDLTGADLIPSGGTGAYSSGNIATALGGGWRQGAGRCDIMSNGTLEVQHMIRTSGNALHNNSVVIGGTQTDTVGLLRGTGAHPLGSITISLGEAAPPMSLYRLFDGRFYGTLTAITTLRDQRAANMGLPPGTRLNAPPSFSGGGFQPMGHEPGCAFLELDNRITLVNCLHDETAPALEGSTPLMSGDILYPSGAVFRPASGRVITQPPVVATGTGFVLSG